MMIMMTICLYPRLGITDDDDDDDDDDDHQESLMSDDDDDDDEEEEYLPVPQLKGKHHW